MGKGRPRARLYPVSCGSVQPTEASDVGAGEREVPTLGVERQGRSSQEKRRRKRKRGVRDKEPFNDDLRSVPDATQNQQQVYRCVHEDAKQMEPTWEFRCMRSHTDTSGGRLKFSRHVRCSPTFSKRHVDVLSMPPTPNLFIIIAYPTTMDLTEWMWKAS